MHHPVEADDLTRELRRAAAALRRSERVAVLTGAGISAGDNTTTRGKNGSSKRRKWKRAGVAHSKTGEAALP